MEVTAKQINFILKLSNKNMTVKKAKQMVLLTLDEDPKRVKEFKDTISCNIDAFENKFKHYPVKMQIESIRKDYLNSRETYQYIMNYPLDHYMKAKKPLKTLKIPEVLGSILTKEQKEAILSKWRDLHGHLNINFE